jgi:hypothetical protein
MYSSEMYYSSKYEKGPGDSRGKEQGMGYAYGTDGHHVDAVKLGNRGHIVRRLHFDLPSYEGPGKKRFRKTPHPALTKDKEKRRTARKKVQGLRQTQRRKKLF